MKVMRKTDDYGCIQTKKFKVYITLLVGTGGDYITHTAEIEAETEGEVLNIITSKPWFGYEVKTKSDGIERLDCHWIQVKHIADIYIKGIEVTDS